MLFICYPKCTICQKAKKWLDEHNIIYTERHIAVENPTYEELREWYEKSGLPLKRFFNTNGMLVKRPLLINGDMVLVGFKEAQWGEEFS